jgi:hypothetical protein
MSREPKFSEQSFDSARNNPLTRFAARAYGRRVVAASVEKWAFCAATGRCGTNTLADLLAPHPDICARHEPYPQPSHDLLASRDAGDFAPVERYWEQKKTPKVYWEARGKKTYLETTHLFMHTFAESAVQEFGDKLVVIHIYRDAHATARSFLKRGQDPINDPWLIHPGGKNVVLDVTDAVAPGGAFDDHYLRLVWYAHEVFARVLKLKAQNPELHLIDFPTDNLNSEAAVKDLLSALGLSHHPDVLANVGKRSNASATPPTPPTHLDAGRIEQFEALLNERYKATGLAATSGVASIRDALA